MTKPYNKEQEEIKRILGIVNEQAGELTGGPDEADDSPTIDPSQAPGPKGEWFPAPDTSVELLTEAKEIKLLNLLSERWPNLEATDTRHRMSQDIYAAMEGIEKIIKLSGDNPSREGVQETPFRVLKSFLEMTVGYGEDPKEHLRKDFEANVSGHDIVLVRDIPFNSMCEHHLVPFYGTISIAYIPGDRITGLSKFARMADGYAKRFQVQENLTTSIADAIDEVLRPIGCAVIINAEHYCMCGRGAMKKGATTTTSTMRGVFSHNPSAKQELLSLLSM